MHFRLALVTGASSGIGKALCHLLANKGISLIACGRNLDHLKSLKKSLENLVSIQIVQADLESETERKKLVEMIHAQKPNLVINNAGFGLYGEAYNFTTEEQLALLTVNGHATLELTLETIKTMQYNNYSGTIFNVSSVAAFYSLPLMAVYAASKSFVTQVSQALDFEVKHLNIRVLTTCPGQVDTEFSCRAARSTVKTHSHTQALSAQFVAEKIWNQIKKQKPVSIIDWRYRLLTFFSSFIPKKLIAHYIKKEISQRITLKNTNQVKQ